MEGVIFACKWDKIREKTWSYTSDNVYQELSKYYKIDDFNINENLYYKIIRKITKKIHCYDFQYHILKKANECFKKKYGDNKVKVFQFAEMPITKYTENYIYQDLSVEYLCQCKNNEPELYNYSGFMNVSEKYLHKRRDNQRLFYKECKAIFTMGQWLADYMVNKCGIAQDKVHAIGAGININPEEIDYTNKAGNKILFVGRDFERKGGPIVLEAFKVLKSKYMQHAELYIIGPKDNPLKDTVPGVYFLGEQSRKETTKYFNLCDIFCMPSYFEAYGIVFAEALCFGLPCIARNRFSMSEIIRDGQNGLLINDDNVENLSEKMYSLLRDEVIKNNVRDRKDEYIHYYSWERVVNDIRKEIH